MRTLRENQRVSYELQEDRRGKMAAVNLKDASDTAAAQDNDAAEAQADGSGEASNEA
jgi:CspA family cold shock protein